MVVVYGSGRIAARVTKVIRSQGISVTLVGRDAAKTAAVARTLGVKHKVARPKQLGEILDDSFCVVNTTGPAVETVAEVCGAAVNNRCHYLDVSNEYGVLQQVALLGFEAGNAGLSLVPGIGFGVAAVQLSVKNAVSSLGSLSSIDVAVLQPPSDQSTPGVRSTIASIIGNGLSNIDNGRLTNMPQHHTKSILDWASKAGIEAVPLATGALEALHHTHVAPTITVHYPTEPRTIMQASICVRAIDLNDKKYFAEFMIPDPDSLMGPLIVHAIKKFKTQEYSPGFATPIEFFTSSDFDQVRIISGS